jgi:hypothetical protein
MPPTQTPASQSPAILQIRPDAHLPAHAPPQSASVSLPFLTPSAHADAWHLDGLPEHTPLWQSAAPTHSLPVTHLGQSDPQSVSVSVWSFTPSVHVGARHVPAVHTPLWQSPPTVHVLVLSHRGHRSDVPPQSTAVSSPFFTPSLQVGT